MIPLVTAPNLGSGLKASWGADVAGAINALAAGLETRAKPLENQRNRRGGAAESRLEAWALQIRQDPRNEEEKTYVVYLPSGSLIWDGKEITPDEIEGVQPYGEDGDWYELVKEFKTEVKLVVTPGEEDESGENKRKFAIQTESDDTALMTITIGTVANFSIVNQVVYGPLVLNTPIRTDEYSVDFKGGGKEEQKLQISHFNDTERDSGKGLAGRIKTDLKTGEISSDDKEIMLVARKKGKIIYIPLSGDGEDPEDDEDGAPDDCYHDKGGGKEGGVSPDDGNHGGNSSGGSTSMDGGVAALGDSHKGDDDCNCN